MNQFQIVLSPQTMKLDLACALTTGHAAARHAALVCCTCDRLHSHSHMGTSINRYGIS